MELSLITTETTDTQTILNSCIIENRSSLINIASGIINDRDTAEDIVQDICLSSLQNADQFRGNSSPKTYLYRVVINRCIDHIRKAKRWSSLFDIIINERSKESRPDYIEVKDLMNRLFSKIPSEFKVPLLLSEIDAMSYEEIAETLNLTLNTVRTRIFRCRERLRKELNNLGIDK